MGGSNPSLFSEKAMQELHIGVTGSRELRPQPQIDGFIELIRDLICRYKPEKLFYHGGDCTGFDAQSYGICKNIFGAWCIGHIPIDSEFRAYCPYDEVRYPKSYFARNRDIVDECDVLIAGPIATTEQNRGGTWYTVNYARKRKKPRFIVWPDGSVTNDGSQS